MVSYKPLRGLTFLKNTVPTPNTRMYVSCRLMLTFYGIKPFAITVFNLFTDPKHRKNAGRVPIGLAKVRLVTKAKSVVQPGRADQKNRYVFVFGVFTDWVSTLRSPSSKIVFLRTFRHTNSLLKNWHLSGFLKFVWKRRVKTGLWRENNQKLIENKYNNTKTF